MSVCVCAVWISVCMRYWMDSIYNWMLSSLTIILPSMTTFFNLFAALNGYYFCFCLFYIAMFLSCFIHAVSCYLCYLFRLYVFFCHCSRSVLFPVCGFLFLCVWVCVNPFLFSPHDYTKYTFTYREYLPLRTKS